MIRTEIKINKEHLRFGRFLPYYFISNLLGSWVSPRYINYSNRLYRNDLNTLRGRLRTHSKEDSFAQIVKTAFKEKWFNWRLHNVGQVTHYEKIVDHDNYKFLIFKLDLSLFQGQNSYKRFLTIASIIEYYTVQYPNRLKVVFVVFNNRQRVRDSLFTKYSLRYKSLYFTAKTIGLLGSLTLLNKIYQYSKNQ